MAGLEYTVWQTGPPSLGFCNEFSSIQKGAAMTTPATPGPLVKYWLEAGTIFHFVKQPNKPHIPRRGEYFPSVDVYKAADMEPVMEEAKHLAQEIYNYGMQTETTDLDLTTAEFREMWQTSQRLLATLKGRTA